MKSVFQGLFVLCAAVLVSGGARGDTPNFNKRGGEKDEKAFVQDVAHTIVMQARTTAKDVTLQDYKFKEVKEGRQELTFSAVYGGAVTKTKYTADIIVYLDTSTKDKWEVERIEYKDNNDNPFPWNRKNVEELVKKFNSVK